MSLCLYLAALLAAVGAEPGVHGEASFNATYERLRAASPADLTFSLKASKRAYQVGELIQLDVTLKCAVKDRYQTYYRPWDHLRMMTHEANYDEVFRVWPQAGVTRVGPDEPKDVVPKTPYPALTEKWDHVILNQWLGFSQPGTYRVYALTNTVWRSDRSQQPAGGLRVTSNMLELEIVPAIAKWQQDELARAVKVLDGDLHGEEDLIWAPTPTMGRGPPKGAEAYQRALLRVRYLKTEDSARELARRLAALDIADANARHTGTDESDAFPSWVLAWWYARFARTELFHALDDSPHLDVAAAELERVALQPSVPVDDGLMSSVTMMKRDVVRPPDRSPMPEEPLARKHYFEAAAEIEKLDAQIAKDFTERLWAAIDTKEPVAKGETMLTLVRWWYLNGQLDGSARARQRLYRIRKTLHYVLSRLPPGVQEQVLHEFWRQLGEPELAPALCRLVERPRKPTDNPASISDSIDWALRRLYQLAPGKGYRLIVAEIRRPQPQVSEATLALLPDSPISGLDALLAERMVQALDPPYSDEPRVSEELTAYLIHRFASAAIRSRVREFQPSSCDARAYLLAYFLRVDPEYGVEQLNAAIDDRSSPGDCWKTVLSTLARVRVTPELERIAIERLDDKNVDVASNAAIALAKIGSHAAQAALWQRMRKLNSDWNQHHGNSRLGRPKPGVQWDQMLLEEPLLTAIMYSPGWLVDEKELSELRELCPMAFGKSVVDLPMKLWTQPIELGFEPGLDSEIADARPTMTRSLWELRSEDNWYAAQYAVHSLSELETLLARFPRGTAFRLPANFAKSEAIETQVRQRLRDFLSGHGMTLTDDKRQGGMRPIGPFFPVWRDRYWSSWAW